MIKRKYLTTISIAFAVALALIPNTQASIGLPDYDSGWMSINQGQGIVLTHNLCTTEVMVYLVGKISSDDVDIHQIQYGGDVSVSSAQGGNWNTLNATTILVRRHPNDDHWNYIRVMIWKIEAQPQGVGGFWISVDKFSLLAPYIISAITIIVVASISVAIIKYRKKQ